MEEFVRDQLFFFGFYTIAIIFFNLLKRLYRFIEERPQLQYSNFDSDCEESENFETGSEVESENEPESESENEPEISDSDSDYAQPLSYHFQLRKRKRKSI